MRDLRDDRVLVVLHSVIADRSVISAAEQLVAGNAQLRFLRVVPRSLPFTTSLLREPPGAAPVRIVTASDDMATTILDLSRELQITLLALGEPPGERSRAEKIRSVLSRVLIAGSAPVLYVPGTAKGARDNLRRILLVLHAPVPAMGLLALAVPLARRCHAELLILTLPSAAPLILDHATEGGAPLPPFDAGAWIEREAARIGCRIRPLPFEGKPAEAILERAAALEVDLVIAGTGLAELRVGWRRRRLLDLLFPRMPCPLLLGRCA